MGMVAAHAAEVVFSVLVHRLHVPRCLAANEEHRDAPLLRSARKEPWRGHRTDAGVRQVSSVAVGRLKVVVPFLVSPPQYPESAGGVVRSVLDVEAGSVLHEPSPPAVRPVHVEQSVYLYDVSL